MKLFDLQSYIKKPKVRIDNLSILNQNPSDYFVRLDDENSFMAIIDDIDRDYIEGVIHFEYNGSVLMDFTYWDIVDQLWAYFINFIEDYIQNQESEIYFPDQPIKLKMKAINESLVLFSIESDDGVQLTLPKEELFKAILDSGEAFFSRLQDYFIHGDKTGYEASNNEIRVNDFVCGDSFDFKGVLTLGFNILDVWSIRLKRDYPDSRFCLIITCENDSVTLRFHQARENESGWLTDDLEQYTDAVAYQII